MIKEKIIDSIKNKKMLTRITLELTNKCNLRCVHCYQEERNEAYNIKFLSLDSIQKLLKDIKNLGIITIVLTGGEVFTHPDIYKIISAIKAENYRIAILSNLTMINEKNIDFLQMNVNSISTSVYGTTKDVYESVTRVKGSYEKYSCAVKLIRSHTDIKLIEKAIVLKNNFCQYSSLINKTDASDARIIVNNSNNYCESLCLNEDELFEYWKLFLDKHKNEEILYKKKKKATMCNAFNDSLFIDITGNIIGCLNLDVPELVLGNINYDNLSDVWHSKKTAAIINNFHNNILNCKCFNCSYGRYAFVCPAYNYYETNNYCVPSSQACLQCEIKHKIVNEKENNYETISFK